MHATSPRLLGVSGEHLPVVLARRQECSKHSKNTRVLQIAHDRYWLSGTFSRRTRWVLAGLQDQIRYFWNSIGGNVCVVGVCDMKQYQ